MNRKATSTSVPKAELAFIGGSGTFSLEFPEGIVGTELETLAVNLVYKTPFGNSPPLKLLGLEDGRRALACRMHGWRPGVSRRSASQQIFWVFREAGVSAILAEGGVGTLHSHSRPGELISPDDYLDLSCRRDTSLSDDFLLIMRNPLCPALRRVLERCAREQMPSVTLHTGGVYAVTDGRHFESRAEVRALAVMGADVIGQSLSPEVYLAREIGACYAGLHQIVNRAEGIGEDWSHEELIEIFHHRARPIGLLMAYALRAIPRQRSCSCRQLRKETLLRFPGTAGPT